MSGQKTIKHFFSSNSKRTLNELTNKVSSKKIKSSDLSTDTSNSKVETCEENGNPQCMQQSSPIKDITVETDKLISEIRLQSQKTPVIPEDFGPSWFEALKSEFNKSYFEKLNNFVMSQREKVTVYPPHDQVFSWTNHCKLDEVKVVILGQDPYHGPGQAHGLCFSVQKDIKSPPSLVNMYKELENDIEGFKRPSHGHLIGWARQGVLLLNACLTVQAHQANSHKDRGWEQFTTSVIKAVAQHNKNVVFLLWGAYAQKKAAFINKKDHHHIHSTHPSPLSAHRGFLGSKQFSKCNELLIKSGHTPVDWTCLPIE